MTVTIIALTGYQRVGKDTVADYLVEHYRFTKMSIAEPIRDGLKAMFPWAKDHIGGKDRHKMISELGTDYRYLGQTLATEWGRELINQDIWVECLKRRIATAKAHYKKMNHDDLRIVVSDMRYPNEMSMLLGCNAKIWHIQKTGVGPFVGSDGEESGWKKLKHQLYIDRVHKSDLPLPLMRGDELIVNGEGKDILFERVDRLIKLLLIIQGVSPKGGGV